jgi:alanine dehydrogenase
VASPLQIRFLARADVDALALTREDIFGAVEDCVRAQGEGDVVLEPRVHLHPPRSSGHFNVLRGHLERQRVSGVKVVGDFVDNYRRGLPSELALITLFDPETGVPMAIVDGTLITEARTGALTALGARHLARPGSRVLGHLGARGTAWWNVVFLDDLFGFEEIRVTSRRPESRQAFARALEAELGKPVRAVESARECLEGADIMVEATRLTEPAVLLETGWVRPGAFVVPYGTVSAVGLDLLDVMDKVVVDDWGQAHAGPFGALRRHVDTGRLTAETLHAELGDVVAGRAPGRESDAERILFWHRGLATTDLAVAHLLVQRAQDAGVGTLVDYR